MVCNKTISESEEMYLVSIARLEESGLECPVPISRLADQLSVQPVSVHQMVRHLEEAGWVSYIPYKGVALTQAGRDQSQRTLRSHRLWEVFLVEQLGILASEADELACRIEHFMPEETVERLAGFLGQPAVCPDGKTIPSPGTEHFPNTSLPLNELQVQQSGILTQIRAEGAIRAFLKSEGLVPGVEIKVLAIGDQGSRLVGLPGGQAVHLALSIVQFLSVQPLSE